MCAFALAGVEGVREIRREMFSFFFFWRIANAGNFGGSLMLGFWQIANVGILAEHDGQEILRIWLDDTSYNGTKRSSPRGQTTGQN